MTIATFGDSADEANLLSKHRLISDSFSIKTCDSDNDSYFSFIYWH